MARPLLCLLPVLAVVAGSAAGARPRVLPLPAADATYTVSFSPDEQWLTVAGDDLTLFQVATGKPLRTFEQLDGFSPPGVFSPDGRWYAASCMALRTKVYEQVCVWRVSTGKLMTSREPGMAWSLDADMVSFAQGGRELVTAKGGTISISSTTNAEVRLTLPGETFEVPARGTWLAVGAKQGPITLHSLTTGKPLRTLEGTSESTEFAADPTGKLIATWSQGSAITVFNAMTGKHVGQVEPGPAPLSSIFFLADGHRLATVDAAQVRIWELPSGRLASTLPYSGELLALSPRGRWMATRRPGEAEIHLLAPRR